MQHGLPVDPSRRLSAGSLTPEWAGGAFALLVSAVCFSIISQPLSRLHCLSVCLSDGLPTITNIFRIPIYSAQLSLLSLYRFTHPPFERSLGAFHRKIGAGESEC